MLAPAGADKRGPKAPFPVVENAGIKLLICKRVPTGAPAGAWSYLKALIRAASCEDNNCQGGLSIWRKVNSYKEI